MNTNGWEKLLCSYFGNVCIGQLSDFFASNGFENIVAQENAVTFKTINAFIEIGYEVESAPLYSPTVVVGLGDKKFDEMGAPASVPMWFAINGGLGKQYSFWKFSNELDLRSVLIRIQNEVLEPYALPLLRNKDLFDSVLSDFRAKLFGNLVMQSRMNEGNPT